MTATCFGYKAAAIRPQISEV